MATVELSCAEARKGDLPRVCIVCGQMGGFHSRKALFHNPWWVYLGIPLGLLPYLVLALLVYRRGRILAPVCASHRYHWLWRDAAGYGWLLLSALLFAVSLVVIVEATLMHDKSVHSDDVALVSFILFFAGYAGLLAWPFVALALKYTGVHLVAASAETITLGDVPVEFVEAVRVRRQDRQTAYERITGASAGSREG